MSHIAASAPNNHGAETSDLVPADTIYKVVKSDLWTSAEQVGQFTGAEIDLTDGFIHFSTADQLATTLRLHFAGQEDLVLVAVDAQFLVGQIVYEPSRGGDLFPHLYAPLPMDAVLSVRSLTLNGNGQHTLPKDLR